MLKDPTHLLATLALLFPVGTALAQSFTPMGDPTADKMAWLQQQTPSTLTNGQCIDPITRQPANTGTPAQVGGTLWPTLVQAADFLSSYPGPTPLCITSGTEGHDPAPSGRGHREGFKVDFRIIDQSNTFQDNLSLFITGAASPDGCRGDESQPASASNDHAPLWTSTSGSTSGIVLAMEHPIPQSLNPCADPYTGVAPHWDLLSSYGGLTVTPTTVAVNVGDYMPVSPAVGTLNLVPIQTTQPWMFDYYFPADPNETIATIDRTGSITGVAGTVIGVSCNAPPCSTVLMVSEGPYFSFVDITVNEPDPPPGGSECQGTTATSCWTWLGNAWVWTPPTPTSSTPTPPGGGLPPPPFGVCKAIIGPVLVPCWEWDPTANNGGGGWIFVPPGGSSSTWMSNPITPVHSLDPNAISGPAGAGAAQYISAVSPIGYAIYFENEPTATAATDQVVVTDQIDLTRFDLTTLTLGPITFPGVPGVLPPAIPLEASGQFSTQVSLTSGNLLVNVTASLNSTTGLLTWTLQAIDPNTGLPPADPSLGILPPGGNGSVSFTARLLPSLATGAVIDDQASVTFDANPPILTAVWSNTLDVTPPTSSVHALPGTESTASFMVNWSGTDIGAGIQSYTIYVSDSGGPYGAWLTQTPSTSAKFIGNISHTYSFYSVATDFAGNTEAAKTSPDTSTSVNLPCAQDSSASFSITRGGFRLNHATAQFTQTVTIQNKSAASITGPISLVLDNLSSGASLTGGAGVTACDAPLNSGFVNLSLGTGGSLAPGGSSTITLTFTDPSLGGITYSTRVLTGAGQR